jgi:hypothetical protein
MYLDWSTGADSAGQVPQLIFCSMPMVLSHSVLVALTHGWLVVYSDHFFFLLEWPILLSRRQIGFASLPMFLSEMGNTVFYLHLD